MSGIKPEQMARIRKRAAVDDSETEEPYVLVACLIQAEDDRRDLLAEVDRLTAMHPYGSQQDIGAAFAVMDERKRIREAVKALPEKFGPPGYIIDSLVGTVSRWVVLAVVDNVEDRDDSV